MALSAEREARLLKAASEACDYRTFLAGVLTALSRDGYGANYAAFARKAGFSSRSFLIEVLEGRRRLTVKSYLKVERALVLPVRLKTYFKLLVALEENELNVENLPPEKIGAKLALLRAKLESDARARANSDRAVDSLFRGRDMLDCYAALGKADIGASLEDVQRKTGLPFEICEMVLSRFITSGVARLEAGRYFPQNPHFIFKGLGANRGVKECYLQSLSELKRKATAEFKGEDRALFQSVFSLDRRDLPRIKQRLWDVLNEFVEAHEDDGGDGIGKVIVGFYV